LSGGNAYRLIRGVEATGKPVEVRDFVVWRFKDGKVVEISAMRDQFSFLKQIGYLLKASTRRTT